LATSTFGAEQAIPFYAQAVVQQVHRAAKAKDYPALEKLMAREFVWSFGGDSDAKQAIQAWKADPSAIRALYRVTGSRCAGLRDGSIECPPKAGMGYRARFKETSDGWLMVSFVAGD
jgi:hypothetical protein